MRVFADAIRRYPALVSAVMIGCLASALYLPFIANPPVFDDYYFFSGQKFAYYATHLFGLDLRVPPYFSLAVVQLMWWGQMEPQRIVTLAFHIACCLALYRLIFDVQQYVARGAGAPPPAGME